MDKATVNLDKATVMNVISDMHYNLIKYGIKENNIALFGSFLNGNNHEDSDIDIVIISPEFEGKNLFERSDMTARAQLDITRKYVVPMDILLKTPKEFDYSNNNYFKAEIII